MADKHNAKVVLVVPKSKVNLANTVPPLGLAYLASYLRKVLPSVEVTIFDGSIRDDQEQFLSDFKPDIVGVTATTPQAPSAYQLGDWIKQNLPKVLTVIGGVHASLLPNEALEHFDVVVIGEGEKTFSQLVKSYIDNSSPRGIYEAEPVENLDDIPSPAFDLIDMQHYLYKGFANPNLEYPQMNLITSRGCPFSCAFCWNSKRKTKIRFSSPERIVEEILFLKKEYGIKSVFFSDDEFLINTPRIHELSKLFKEYDIDKWLKWGCQVRATTVTADLIKTVKEMGCVLLSVGFESGNERVLNYLKAGSTTLAANERALDIADEVGVTMGGSFIFGTPTETLDEMKQTLNWIISHRKLKFFYTPILAPFPETPVWDLCMENGILPKEVNYERLIADPNEPESMYQVSTVPPEVFSKFLKDVDKITWFLNAVRANPSLKHFLLTLILPSGLRLFARHPMIVLKEVYATSKSGKH